MSTQLTSGYLPVTLFSVVDSTSITSGALIINGGVGIAKKVFIGDLLTLQNNITNVGTANFTITGGTSSITLQPASINANILLTTTGTGRAKVSFDPVSTDDVVNKGYVDKSRIFSFSYATSTTNYIQINSTSTYTAVSDFIFLGSTAIGTPTKFLINARMAATVANRRIRWRIFDITNAQVICQSATTNSSAVAIIDMGAITNIPTGQAIFQLQQQDTNSADVPTTHATDGRVASLMYY